jgi:hypothetical protein
MKDQLTCEHKFWTTKIDDNDNHHHRCSICGHEWNDDNLPPYIPEYYKGNKGLTGLEIIDQFHLNYLLGNAVKYIIRAGRKTDNSYRADITKAINCLALELERITKLYEGK